MWICVISVYPGSHCSADWCEGRFVLASTLLSHAVLVFWRADLGCSTFCKGIKICLWVRKCMCWTDSRKGIAAGALFIYFLPVSNCFIYSLLSCVLHLCWSVSAYIWSFADYWFGVFFFFLSDLMDIFKTTLAFDKRLRIFHEVFTAKIFQRSISAKIVITCLWNVSTIIPALGKKIIDFPLILLQPLHSFLSSLLWAVNNVLIPASIM